jgi:hypothetical protein
MPYERNERCQVQCSHTQLLDIVKAHVPHVHTTSSLTDIQLADSKIMLKFETSGYACVNSISEPTLKGS